MNTRKTSLFSPNFDRDGNNTNWSELRERIKQSKFRALLQKDIVVNPDPSFDRYYRKNIVPKLEK